MNYTSREVYEFISAQNNDPIVEWKTCTISGQPFAIYQSDLDFYKKMSPTFSGQRFPIPSPTLCPEERQRRRLMRRNERKLYKKKCDATGDSIVSIYSPEKVYKVYKQDFWWSDEWDAIDYGIDFDFNKSFSHQYHELLLDTPLPSLSNFNNENCDYANYLNDSKDCYLVA